MAVVQLHDQMRMLRLRKVLRHDKQLPRHAQVEEQPVAVFENERQEFPATVHAANRVAAQSIAEFINRRMRDYFTVKHIHGYDAAIGDLWRDDCANCFDFRQFRHDVVSLESIDLFRHVGVFLFRLLLMAGH